MSDKTITATGRFVWYELITVDVDASRSFFSELFGWTTKEQDMGPSGKYTMIQSGGTDIGGIVPSAQDQGAPSHWLAYVTVDDLVATLAKVKELGGQTITDVVDIPDVGRFAVIQDPAGATIAPFQGHNEPPPEPAGLPPAGKFCWAELLTTDTEGAARFYGGIFEWTMADTAMGEADTYHIFKRGDKDTAGMMQKPADTPFPPFWLIYVAVDDVDATAARVKELGGGMLVEPADIPHVGRFAVCADRTGAAFALFKGSPPANN